MKSITSQNIGFDAKRLFFNKSGLGNYSRWLVQGLTRNFPQHTYHLYTPGISPFGRDFELPNTQIHLPPNLFKSFWRSKGIKKDLIKDRISIYHGLSNELPMGIEKTGIKTVVTIHDLIFRLYPEFYKTMDRFIYEKKFRSACERADKIVAISAHTRRCIIDFYGIEPSKVDVIYLDASEKFKLSPSREKVEEVKKKFGIDVSFFLNVGALGGRKNQWRLLEAFAAVANHIEQDLVFVGTLGRNAGEWNEKCEKLSIGSRVKFLENISDDDLFNLYHGSYATVFPSIYEGFGIPILESYRCGKPVITSYGSSLEEVCGSAGLLVNPLQVEDIAEKLMKIADYSTYQHLTDKISSELLRFDSSASFQKYMEIYSKLSM